MSYYQYVMPAITENRNPYEKEGIAEGIIVRRSLAKGEGSAANQYITEGFGTAACSVANFPAKNPCTYVLVDATTSKFYVGVGVIGVAATAFTEIT